MGAPQREQSPPRWSTSLLCKSSSGFVLLILSVRFGVLLLRSLLLSRRRQEACMTRRGQVATKASAWRFRSQFGEDSQVGRLVVLGCLERGECIFLSLLQRETGSRKDRTTQRGRSPCFPRVLVHIHMGMAQLSGHELAGGVGHCLPVCGGLSQS